MKIEDKIKSIKHLLKQSKEWEKENRKQFIKAEEQGDIRKIKEIDNEFFNLLYYTSSLRFDLEALERGEDVVFTDEDGLQEVLEEIEKGENK